MYTRFVLYPNPTLLKRIWNRYKSISYQHKDRTYFSISNYQNKNKHTGCNLNRNCITRLNILGGTYKYVSDFMAIFMHISNPSKLGFDGGVPRKRRPSK